MTETKDFKDDLNTRIKKVIIEMFEQRGYSDIDREDNHILACKQDGTNICAFTQVIEKLNIAAIHNYIAKMEEIKVNHILLVYSGTPTPAVKNVIDNTVNIMMTIELFNEENLFFNITKHRLQPKFEVLERNESKVFKEKTKLPVMLRSDPIALFYNYQKGDVVKITRKNDTVTYRIVKKKY